MPIFEYICKDCARSFERILPRHDSSTDCPHCRSANIEKQLSVFAVAGPGNDFAADSSAPGCGRCGAAQPGMCGLSD
jgi:putative FmdB family regulatory protein